jgi:hypothetical protein
MFVSEDDYDEAYDDFLLDNYEYIQFPIVEDVK